MGRSLPYLCQCCWFVIDRYPDYTTETDLGDRPPTPTQQRDENSKRKACKKKTNLSAIPYKVCPGVLPYRGILQAFIACQ
jgi:hypothetical protein